MRLSKFDLIRLNSPNKTWADKRVIVERACAYADKVRDPKWWSEATSFQREDAIRFRHTEDQLLTLALRHPPAKRGSRVTDFSGWLFSLYAGEPDPRALAHGKAVERQIARLMPAPTASGWRLVHQDPLDEATSGKCISSLLVDGAPLRGCPDLVFQDENDGTVVIVERKTSHREIPSNGWPNLRAQLWAYGKIDEYASAPRITLIGEVWGYAVGMHDGVIRKRASLMWRGDDGAFEASNRQLFDVYSGAPQPNS